MSINILMPALSPTMTEGTLARWHVKEGDEVNNGDVVAEIETDKATMEVEAVEEGTVGKILVDAGTEGVKVNEPIAILLEEGEDASAVEQAGTGGGGDGGGSPEPAETAPAESTASGGDGAAGAPATRGGTAVADEAPPAPPAPKDTEGNRVFASPLARRIAKQSGIDLTQLSGSGPHGRIVRADVEAAIEKGVGAPAPEKAAEKPADKPAPAAAPEKPAAPAPKAKEQADLLGQAYEEVPLSQMRRTIAKRMSESKQEVPHFYLTVDIEMDELLRVRKELNGRAEQRGEDYKLSVNDFLIRACALSLRQVPEANTAYNGSTALRFQHADVSVAVAIPDGLITPVVKQAETKGLAAISREMKDLAKRARDGKLTPEEYQGGTFSLTNLGMFGIDQFHAIINPPQACILAVGKSEQRPVVKDGALSVATMMTATLSVDHRVVDGAIGARFLDAVKTLLEDPLSMLL
ncbi:pyruvate dehydrogenase E2 component (dihydrolipoamide acetyltransferase) [Limimonas halophila]|uniref:Acetyltransferase component of pyruvate dehydrogenase complex n=1 Tax=Limimonas halophila TaxID=1082479 RepID=A0A1G7NBT9_9PROT|nr:pyruvate dehydrogenase complex dihydrolipoamide acetyltransferase [Limimonas halophila]SDF71422.1 pyruvate dehydrogenase E2 component (dihydrolipoamide acetyltransferase) [Limimonas halophila]